MDEETTEVRGQHQFNLSNLQNYLSNCVSNVSNSDTFSVRQYSAGQSNPTFLVTTSRKSYVLRKKPPGMLLPGAHKVDREYWVQKALFSAGFPVPKPVLYCADVSVIGTEFYLMEHVQGRIFRDQRLTGVSVAERAALYTAAAEVLARLHSADLTTLGLNSFGKGTGYCKRQLSTWTRQYKASAHQEIQAMDKLADWLLMNLPDNDSQVTLVHGDYRLENIIFHPTEARVLAVLDWELSTTGHPIVDLAYFLMPFYWPSHITILKTIGGLKGLEGLPAPEDLMAIYCRCRRIPLSLPEWNFFLALSTFKMAAIAQGVYARHLQGNASSPDAASCGQSVEPLAQIGLQIAESACALGSEDRSSDLPLFPQSRRGQLVLRQVRAFMSAHVLPAQQHKCLILRQMCQQASLDREGSL